MKKLELGYVDQKDLDNPNLDMLPIRNGCSGGPCACSGYCQRIQGFVKRDAWEKRLAYRNLAQTLIDITEIYLADDPEAYKELKEKYLKIK